MKSQIHGESAQFKVRVPLNTSHIIQVRTPAGLSVKQSGVC